MDNMALLSAGQQVKSISLALKVDPCHCVYHHFFLTSLKSVVAQFDDFLAGAMIEKRKLASLIHQ